MTFSALRCQRRRCGATYGCGADTRRHGGQGIALHPYTSQGYPGRCCSLIYCNPRGVLSGGVGGSGVMSSGVGGSGIIGDSSVSSFASVSSGGSAASGMMGCDCAHGCGVGVASARAKVASLATIATRLRGRGPPREFGFGL